MTWRSRAGGAIVWVTALGLAASVAFAAKKKVEPKLLPPPWADGEALFFVSRAMATPIPTPTPTPRPAPGTTSTVTYGSPPPPSSSGALVAVREANGHWSLRTYVVTAMSMSSSYGMLSATTTMRTVETEPDTLLPLTYFQRDSMGGEVRARYGKGRVDVTSSRRGVNTYPVEDEVFEAAELPFLLRRLPLAEGYATSFPMFMGGVGVYPLKVSVVGRETLTVPAGRFECFKVEAEGGPHPRTFWLSTDARRYLVREADDSRVQELIRVGRWDEAAPLEIRDEKWNVSLTPPPRWVSQPPRHDNEWTLGFAVISADGDAQCSVRVENFLLLLKERPGARPAGWKPEPPRKLAERDVKLRTRFLQSLAVRPESWTERTAGGISAVRFVADFVLPRSKNEIVEYASYSTEPVRAVTACYVPRQAFESRRAELEAVMDSLRIQ